LPPETHAGQSETATSRTQESGGDTAGTPVIKSAATTTRWHEPVEIIFSIAVLAFGAGLIVLFTSKVLSKGPLWRGMYLRLVVLSIVVTAGLFALTAGYSEAQISPMMGLLGTLVGYLLGREAPPVPADSLAPQAPPTQ
jgi:hypothetical protein